MRSDVSRLISRIHDAALVPDAWPEALRSLTEVMGVAGAAYIVSIRESGEWTGPAFLV
jgi:hypothetical protein